MMPSPLPSKSLAVVASTSSWLKFLIVSVPLFFAMSKKNMSLPDVPVSVCDAELLPS